MGVRSLGYLRLESTDVDAWKVFGGDFLGMMPVEGADPDSLYFRLDHYPPRLVVEPGAENRMTAMGFEVLDKRELARLVSAVEGAGDQGHRRRAGGLRGTAGHRFRLVRRSGRQPGRTVLRSDPRPRPGADAARQLIRHRRHGNGSRDRVGRGCRGDARLLHRRARFRRAQHDGSHVVPRVQPAAPHVRHRPSPRPGRAAAPDGRGGHARRRRARHRSRRRNSACR